ncbi:MAG TPA: DUF72 domain-containing protein [Vicinamibacterales bacterium]|nr:DUF72 domain-containing protein [Vicinamibacterales bacterium]
MGEIRIGTSGWSYASGQGTWNGVFYPAGPARPRGFKELAFYAQHFDTVEINSTFYRPPAASSAKKWVGLTPPGFEFSVKLYQKFTHPEMFVKATGQDPHDLGRADVDEFRSGIEPLAESGKLGVLLAQFPASFRSDDNARGYVAWLLETFREYPMAVELRHRSWSDNSGETLAILAATGAAWVQIDEPKFRFSIRQTFRPNTPGLFYMRLHGRNAANWWTHKASEDRYNYLYTSDELKPVAEAVEGAARVTRKAYVYMNNHYSAKSVVNAAVLKHQLGLDVPGEYPPEFLERYPEVAGIVKPTSRPPSGTFF